MFHHTRRLLIGALLLTGFFVGPLRKAHAFDEDYHEKINGTTLHFRVRGDNKTNPYLLILHGGPGFSAHMFYAWGASLEKTVNVVYLDQRGSGESERLKFAQPLAPTPDEVADYTIANLIKDCEGVREFLKVDKWFVLGHSWGGMLGLEYVAAHPERMRGYIHLDGAVSFRKVQEALLTNADARFAEQERSEDKETKAQAEANRIIVTQLRALPPDSLPRFLKSIDLAMGPAELYFAKNQSVAFPAFLMKTQQAVKDYHVPPDCLAEAHEPGLALMQTEKLLTRDDTPLLAQIKVPTLLINGKQDGLVTLKMAEAAQKAIQGSQLVLFTDCGHFPFAEQPNKTTWAVLDFVTAQQKEKSQ